MFNVKAKGVSVVRAMLLGTTAITLLGVSTGVAFARVGVTSATAGDPTGKPPAEAERVLRIGIDVQANEVITTKSNDRAHLVFLDGTALSVGPDAQLTIDKFVYDPNTKQGDLAINASKGVFRLVGGKISKTNPVTITTPSGTIGIRGGITMVTVKPNSTTSTFVFGNGMTFTNNGQTQTVTRPGSQVTGNAGAAPGAPTMVAKGDLGGAISALEGGGQSGGSSGGGSSGGSSSGGGSADQKAQSSGLSSANSGSSAAQPPSTNAVTVTAAAKSNDPNTVVNALSTQNTQEQQQQAIQQQQVVIPPPPPPPPGTTVIVTQGRLLADPPYSSFDSTTLAAPRIPANYQTLAASGTALNGVATITSADGKTQFQVPWLPGRGFDFAGSNGFVSGKGVVSPNQDFFGYVFTDAAGKKTTVFGGAPTTTANMPRSGFATHALTDITGVPGNLPFANSAVGGDPNLKAAATTSPLYSAYSQTLGVPIPPMGLQNDRATSLQVTVSISGEGAAQKSYHGAFIGTYFADYSKEQISVMNSGGFNASYRMGGQEKIGRLTSAISTADTPQGNAIYGPNGDYMVLVPDSARSTVSGGTGTTVRTEQAALNQPYTNLNGSDYYPVTLAAKTPSLDIAKDLGQNRTAQTMNGYVGGIIEASDGAGGYSTRVINANEVSPTNVSITTDPATNRAQATIKITNFSTIPNVTATFELGSLTGNSASSSAFIDDRRYAMVDRIGDPSRFSKVTTVPGGTDIAINSRTFLSSYDSAPVALPGGVQPCKCDFMSWGWWSGDIRYDNEGFRQGQRDRLNMATFVTGTLTNSVQMPLTGTATYTGHTFGNVVNGANSYSAAGTYSNTWNFGAGTGQVQMTFDNRAYTGNTALTAPGSVNFTGPIAGGDRSGALSGSFYQSKTDPVAGQGGSFAINGPNYKAGGGFVAKK
jgi:hypothetical protein